MKAKYRPFSLRPIVVWAQATVVVSIVAAFASKHDWDLGEDRVASTIAGALVIVSFVGAFWATIYPPRVGKIHAQRLAEPMKDSYENPPVQKATSSVRRRGKAPKQTAAIAALLLSLPAASARPAIESSDGSTVVSLPRLPVQAHSFNDLDIWPQLLQKGVRLIKLDISMCDKPSCTGYSTFGQPGRGTASDCWEGFNTTLCCVCFRGDASSRPVLYSPFNTSADMLQWVDDNAGSPYLHDAAFPLRIALDYGSGSIPSLDFFNETQAALIHAFVLGLQSRIVKYNLSLAPYFDSGMNGWWAALDSQCAAGGCPAGSTLAALQAVPFLSETGDSLPPPASDPYGRVRILNSDAHDFAGDCNTSSWASSVNRTVGAWQWWEPSSQLDMLTLASQVQACASLPPSHASLNDGHTIVSNQNPEMVEVYSSSRIGRGLDALLLGKAYTNPRMAVVTAQPAAGAGYDRFAIVAGQRASDGGYDVLSIGVTDGPAPAAGAIIGNVSLPAAGAAMPAHALVSLAVYEPAGTPAGVDAGDLSQMPFALLAGAGGQLAVLSVDPVTGDVALLQTSLFPVNATGGSGATVAAATPVCVGPASAGANGTCAVVAVLRGSASTSIAAATLSRGLTVVLDAQPIPGGLAADQGAGLALVPSSSSSSIQVAAQQFEGLVIYGVTHTYEMATAPAAASADKLAGSRSQTAVERALHRSLRRACKNPAAVVAGHSLFGAVAGCGRDALAAAWRDETAALNAALQRSAGADAVALAGQHELELELELQTSTRSELFGAMLSLTLNVSSSGTVTGQLSVTAPSVPRRIGIGSEPHVAAAVFGGEPVVLVTNGDGTCQCGLLQNNDETPHCQLPTPAVDGNLILNLYQSVTYLLNYNYGKLSAFQSMLAGSNPSNVFSMCNAHIMSGKFECGTSATGALFTRQVLYRNATEAPNNDVPVPELSSLFMHDGDVLCPITTTVVCGSPNYKGGLVLSNFRLVQPDELLT